MVGILRLLNLRLNPRRHRHLHLRHPTINRLRRHRSPRTRLLPLVRCLIGQICPKFKALAVYFIKNLTLQAPFLCSRPGRRLDCR